MGCIEGIETGGRFSGDNGMSIYFNPDNSNFKECVEMDIYVDKSMLLSETNRSIGTADKYICMSRPRRFGKTVAGNMIAALKSDIKSEIVKEYQDIGILKNHSLASAEVGMTGIHKTDLRFIIRSR